MNAENKTCGNCKAGFVVEADDFDFYQKISTPPPTLCPDCRHQRRLAIRNERTFYHRTCDSCSKKLISYFPAESEQVVWCPECWYSDKLDPYEYGIDFDFSRPFFEQFREQYRRIPTLSLDIINCKDCEYVSYCGDDNRCYLDIAGEANEDCYYCKFVKHSRDCIDCSFVYHSELNYECVNCHRVGRSTFLDRCQDCSACHFCYDCRGCTDCFGCWNLRNKKYHIFNQPYSKEEYEKKVKELQRGSFSGLEKIRQEFGDKAKDALIRYAFLVNCVNCTGDDQKDCKNVRESFDVTNAENSKWLWDVLDAKECYDLNFSLYKPEFSVELISTLNMGRSGFCFASHYCNDVWYSDKCNNSSDLFGCIAMNKKKYCIFNKQYEKEDYEALKNRIVEHMRETGEWGEFFPVGTSGFGYNETVAQEYYPLTREECLAKGWPWSDKKPGTYGQETLKPGEVPDHIKDVDDSITKEILACDCGRNYKIAPYELGLYRKLEVPLPRQCPECRHYARNKIAGERQLHPRQCMCDYKVHDNTTRHEHHPEGRCPNEFETSYAPDRPEIVYCEQCYQAEVA